MCKFIDEYPGGIHLLRFNKDPLQLYKVIFRYKCPGTIVFHSNYVYNLY